jgi:hypothetical protein
MDWTWIAIGVLCFVVLCCIAAIFGLSKAVTEVRELADLRKDFSERDNARVWERLWALDRGMAALGLVHQQGSTIPASYVSKGGPERCD